MRAAVGISTHLDPEVAIAEAALAALTQGDLSRVDFALVLVSAAHGSGIERIAASAPGHLGTQQILGTSVEGVLCAGQEISHNPAVAVLALEDADVDPFLISDLARDEAGAGPELRNQLGELAASDLVVLFPDPLAVLPARLLPSLEASLAPARVVGGAAGCVAGGCAVAWRGVGPLKAGGLAGFALRSGVAEIAVTQACHRVTQSLKVTRSRGNWILSIDERPALDVYREAALGPLSEDLRRASRFLMVAIANDPTLAADVAESAGFEVRHVVGTDEARGAISLPLPVPSGSTIWLSLLDPDAARRDLGEQLAAAPEAPDFGLYFNCRARGESLFGVSGLEAGYLARQFGEAPMIGSFGAFQIAPRAGSLIRAQVLTYAGVLTLIS